MKSGIFLITTLKEELINDPSIIIVDTCLRSKCNDKSDNKYKPSGIVVLLVCKLDRSHERTGRAWGKEHYIAIKQSKPNIIGSNMGHFGSEGHYYSHGNKGNFGIVDGSSVGQYVIKPYKKESPTALAKEGAKVIEEMATQELGVGIDGLSKLIKNWHL